MDIDRKELLSLLGFPLGDKWFARGIESRIERIDAAGVEAVSTLAKEIRNAREENT